MLLLNCCLTGDWANGKCHGWGRSTWSSLVTEDVVAVSAALSASTASRGRRAGRFISAGFRFPILEEGDTFGEIGCSGELYEGELVDGVREGQVGYRSISTIL